jgi:hypothetical protein
MILRSLISFFLTFLLLGCTQGANTYYVNDGSLVGDVYCSAVGNDGNAGTAPQMV